MITIPVHYAYLALSLATLAVWAILFWLDRESRRRQLILSVVFSLAGPIGELFYIPDYWHPATVWSLHIFKSYMSIEDLIFSFAIMGIMNALPALILGISARAALAWSTVVKMGGVLGLVAMMSLLLWRLDLNSIFATSFAMLAAAGVVLLYARQRVLLKASIIGALGMVCVMFVIYWLAFVLVADSDSILRATWSLYGTTLGIRVLRVPLPELVWAFCFGSLFSVLFLRDRVRGLP